MGLILLIAVIAYTAICIGWNLIFNTNSKFRLYTVITVAVVSFILALIFKFFIATPERVMAIVESVMGTNEQLSEVLGISPSLASNIIGLVRAVATPLVFFVCFVVLEIIAVLVKIIVFIVKKATHKCQDKTRLWVRAAFGAGQALVFLMCFLVPVSFYLGVADTALDTVNQMSAEEEPDQDMVEITNIVKELNSSPVVVAHRYTGGFIITKPLTLFSVDVGDDSEIVSVDSELSAVIELVDIFSKLTEKDIEQYGDAEAKVLEGLGSSVMKSKIVAAAVSDVVGNATEAWENGEQFMGIDKPSLDPKFDPLTDKIINILGKDSSNSKYLEEDINTFAKLAAKFVSTGVLAQPEESETDMMQTLLDEKFVTSLITILNDNSRMRPLIPTLTNIGLRIIGESLGIPETSGDAYRTFTSDILNELKLNSALNADVRITKLTDEMSASLDRLGVAGVDKAELSVLATALIDYFSDPDSATVEDIQQFFDDVTTAAEETASGNVNVSGSSGSNTAKLDARTESAAYRAGVLLAKIKVINEDGTVTDKTLLIASVVSESGLFEGEARDEIRNGVISGVVDKENTAVTKSVTAIINLGTKDESKTPFTLTVSAILIDDAKLDAMANLGDKDAENLKNSIVEVFKSGSQIVTSVTNSGEGDVAIGDVLVGVGGVLDALAGNDDLYGAEKTDKLMGAILNSSMVKESAGLSANDIETIISAKNDNATSYGAVLNSVSTVTDIITSLMNGAELTDDTVGKLVDALTTENAGAVISTLVKSEMFKEIMGDENEEVEVLLDFFSDIFITAGSITDKAEHDKEVAAIKHIFNVLIKEDDASTDSAFGENGYFECSAAELVDSFLASKSVCTALSNLDLESYGIDGAFTGADAEAVASVINARKATANETELKALNSLEKLLVRAE